jgi:hypothetical protein
MPTSCAGVSPNAATNGISTKVCGDSQSFNVVNTVRLPGRWMRMFTIPNQSPVRMAYKEFDGAGRMRPSSCYIRVVDVKEDLYKMTQLMRGRIECGPTPSSNWRNRDSPYTRPQRAPLTPQLSGRPATLPCLFFVTTC